MRRISLLATATIICASSSALAADLYVETPEPASVPVVAAPTWTGLYLGLNAGYLWGDLDGGIDVGANRNGEGDLVGVLGNDPIPFDLDGEGWLGGAQIGYNHQFGSFVFGLEGDLQFTTLSEEWSYDEVEDDEINVITNRAELDWLGTLRARAGYAFDRVLVYGTGGHAVAGGEVSVENFYAEDNGDLETGTFSDTEDFTTYGWTAGLGVEAMLAERVSAKIEYLYVDLHEEDLDFDFGDDTNRDAEGDIDLDGHVFRVGLNYKFW